MGDFISEPITPRPGRFDAAAMGRGEPGLPSGFTWRGASYEIVAHLAQWKGTSAEGGRPGADVYLRRHYYKLSMTDGSVWTAYFIRRTPSSGSPRARWFLYSRENADRREPPAANKEQRSDHA